MSATSAEAAVVASYPVGIPLGIDGAEDAVAEEGVSWGIVVVVDGGEAAADGDAVAGEEEEEHDEGTARVVDGLPYVWPWTTVVEVLPGGGGDHDVDHVAIERAAFSIPGDWWDLHVKHVIVRVAAAVGVMMVVLIIVVVATRPPST
jgi:hypothetical protein